MKHFRFSAISAASIIAVHSAMASTATAHLSNLSIELTDLDPTDGIAPSVIFQSNQGGALVAAEAGTPDDPVTDVQWAGTPFAGASAKASFGADHAAATMTGAAIGRKADVLVSASTILPGTYSTSSVWMGDGGQSVSFALSPETRLSITGYANVFAMSTMDVTSADTWASIFLELSDYTGLGEVSWDGLRVEQFSAGTSAPYASIDSRAVSVSFENDSQTSADGIFTGTVDASASALLVAEPANWTLFGAAFLALFATRRRLIAESRQVG